MIGTLLMISIIAVPLLVVAAGVKPIAYSEYDCDNGLHVIIHEDHTTPIVTVSVWYHVGSRDEETHRTGFAHLFEHLMFQGSEHVKKQEHFKYIQDVGGTLNASTSADRTNYFETVPSQYLALALWLESDRMRSLAITQENFENQRAVVKEERRQRYDNVPYGTLFERLLDTVFTSSGYHWSTIGSMEHLDNAQLDDVRAFHSKYYVPNNDTLVLSGDVDPASAKQLVAQYFGDIPRGAAVTHAPVNEPPIAQQVRVTTTEEVPQTLVAIAFHAPSETHPDAHAVQFLAEILGGGQSSPLYHRLVYTEQIATSIGMHPIQFESVGLVLIEAMVAAGADPAQVEKSIWEELAKVRASAPDAHALEKARNGMLKHVTDQRTSVFSRSQLLSQAHVYFGSAAHANEEWQAVEAVTAEDVRRVAQLFDPAQSAVFTIFPAADGHGATHE